MNEQQGIKPHVIGLDLGGTNAVFGIVDQRGDIKATTAIKTQDYDTAEAFVNASINALQPEQIQNFDKGGYSFDPERSSGTEYCFLR